jgi:hypothetical protein
VAWRERHALDTRGARWITAGRTAGTVGGLWVLVAVPAGSLSPLIGASTILAALATLAAPSFLPGQRAFLAAGAVTGVTETATGIGGPSLALVYRHRPAPVLRSTVAVCFVVGELISLALLAATGRSRPINSRRPCCSCPPSASARCSAAPCTSASTAPSCAPSCSGSP